MKKFEDGVKGQQSSEKKTPWKVALGRKSEISQTEEDLIPRKVQSVQTEDEYFSQTIKEEPGGLPKILPTDTDKEAMLKENETLKQVVDAIKDDMNEKMKRRIATDKAKLQDKFEDEKVDIEIEHQKELAMLQNQVDKLLRDKIEKENFSRSDKKQADNNDNFTAKDSDKVPDEIVSELDNIKRQHEGILEALAEDVISSHAQNEALPEHVRESIFQNRSHLINNLIENNPKLLPEQYLPLDNADLQSALETISNNFSEFRRPFDSVFEDNLAEILSTRDDDTGKRQQEQARRICQNINKLERDIEDNERKMENLKSKLNSPDELIKSIEDKVSLKQPANIENAADLSKQVAELDRKIQALAQEAVPKNDSNSSISPTIYVRQIEQLINRKMEDQDALEKEKESLTALLSHKDCEASTLKNKVFELQDRLVAGNKRTESLLSDKKNMLNELMEIKTSWQPKEPPEDMLVDITDIPSLQSENKLKEQLDMIRDKLGDELFQDLIADSGNAFEAFKDINDQDLGALEALFLEDKQLGKVLQDYEDQIRELSGDMTEVKIKNEIADITKTDNPDIPKVLIKLEEEKARVGKLMKTNTTEKDTIEINLNSAIEAKDRLRNKRSQLRRKYRKIQGDLLIANEQIRGFFPGKDVEEKKKHLSENIDDVNHKIDDICNEIEEVYHKRITDDDIDHDGDVGNADFRESHAFAKLLPDREVQDDSDKKMRIDELKKKLAKLLPHVDKDVRKEVDQTSSIEAHVPTDSEIKECIEFKQNLEESLAALIEQLDNAVIEKGSDATDAGKSQNESRVPEEHTNETSNNNNDIERKIQINNERMEELGINEDDTEYLQDMSEKLKDSLVDLENQISVAKESEQSLDQIKHKLQELEHALNQLETDKEKTLEDNRLKESDKNSVTTAVNDLQEEKERLMDILSVIDEELKKIGSSKEIEDAPGKSFLNEVDIQTLGELQHIETALINARLKETKSKLDDCISVITETLISMDDEEHSPDTDLVDQLKSRLLSKEEQYNNIKDELESISDFKKTKELPRSGDNKTLELAQKIDEFETLSIITDETISSHLETDGDPGILEVLMKKKMKAEENRKEAREELDRHEDTLNQEARQLQLEKDSLNCQLLNAESVSDISNYASKHADPKTMLKVLENKTKTENGASASNEGKAGQLKPVLQERQNVISVLYTDEPISRLQFENVNNRLADIKGRLQNRIHELDEQSVEPEITEERATLISDAKREVEEALFYITDLIKDHESNSSQVPDGSREGFEQLEDTAMKLRDMLHSSLTVKDEPKDLKQDLEKLKVLSQEKLTAIDAKIERLDKLNSTKGDHGENNSEATYRRSRKDAKEILQKYATGDYLKGSRDPDDIEEFQKKLHDELDNIVYLFDEGMKENDRQSRMAPYISAEKSRENQDSLALLIEERDTGLKDLFDLEKELDDLNPDDISRRQEIVKKRDGLSEKIKDLGAKIINTETVSLDDIWISSSNAEGGHNSVSSASSLESILDERDTILRELFVIEKMLETGEIKENAAHTTGNQSLTQSKQDLENTLGKLNDRISSFDEDPELVRRKKKTVSFLANKEDLKKEISMLEKELEDGSIFLHASEDASNNNEQADRKGDIGLKSPQKDAERDAEIEKLKKEIKRLERTRDELDHESVEENDNGESSLEDLLEEKRGIENMLQELDERMNALKDKEELNELWNSVNLGSGEFSNILLEQAASSGLEEEDFQNRPKTLTSSVAREETDVKKLQENQETDVNKLKDVNQSIALYCKSIENELEILKGHLDDDSFLEDQKDSTTAIDQSSILKDSARVAMLEALNDKLDTLEVTKLELEKSLNNLIKNSGDNQNLERLTDQRSELISAGNEVKTMLDDTSNSQGLADLVSKLRLRHKKLRVDEQYLGRKLDALTSKINELERLDQSCDETTSGFSEPSVMDSNKQEFENIISDLKKDIRDREAKEAEYLMLLDNSKKDLSTIATENETLKDEIQTLEKALDAARTELNDAEERYHDAQSELNKKGEDLHALTERQQELISANEEMLQMAEVLDEENNAKSLVNEELREENEALKKLLKQSETDPSNKLENQNLAAEKKELALLIDDMENKILEMKKDNESLTDSVEALQKEIKQRSEQQEKDQHALSEILNENSLLAQDIQNFKKEIEEKDKQHLQDEQALNEVMDENSRLATDVTKLAEKLEESDKEIGILRKSISEKQLEELNEIIEENNSLHSKLQELRKELDNKNEEILVKEEILTSLDKDHAELTQDKNQAHKDIEDKVEEMANLLNELENAKERLSDLEETKRTLTGERVKLLNTVDSLQGDKEKLLALQTEKDEEREKEIKLAEKENRRLEMLLGEKSRVLEDTAEELEKERRRLRQFVAEKGETLEDHVQSVENENVMLKKLLREKENDLRTTVDDMQREKTDLKTKLKKENDNFGEIIKKLADDNKKMKKLLEDRDYELQEMTGKSERELARLRKNVDGKNDEIQEVLADLNNYKASCNTLKQELQEAKAEKDNAESECSKMSKKLESILQDLDDSEKEIMKQKKKLQGVAKQFENDNEVLQGELRKLKAALQEKDATIDALRTENEDSKNARYDPKISKEDQQMLQELKAEKDRSEWECSQMSKRLESIKQDLNDSEEQVIELKKKLRNENKELQSENERLENELRRFKAALRERDGTIDSLRTENEGSRKAKYDPKISEDDKEKMQELKAEKDLAEMKCSKMLKSLESIQQDLDESEKQMAKLKQKLQDENKQLENDNEQLENELRKLKTSLLEKDATIDTLHKENEESKKVRYDSKISKEDDYLLQSASNNEIQNLHDQIKNLQKENELEQESRNLLEEQLEKMRQSKESLVDEYEEENKTLKERLQNMKQKYGEIVDDLEREKQKLKNAQMDARFTRKDKEIEKLKTELDKSKATCRSLDNELQDLRDEKYQMGIESARKSKKLDSRQQDLNQLERENKKLKKELRDANDQFENEKEPLERELRQLKAAMKNKDSEIGALNSENKKYRNQNSSYGSPRDEDYSINSSNNEDEEKLRRKIKSLQNQLQAENDSRDLLLNQFEKLKDVKEALTNDFEDQTKKLKDQLQNSKEKYQEVEDELEEERRKKAPIYKTIDRLKEDLRDKHKTRMELEDKVKRNNEDIKNLNNQLQEKDKTIKALKTGNEHKEESMASELKKLRRENKKLSSAVQELEKQLQSEEQDKSLLKDTWKNELQRQKEDMENYVKDYLEDVKKMIEDGKDEHGKEKENWSKKLTESRDEVDQLHQDMERYRSVLDNVKKELRKSKQTLKEREKEHENELKMLVESLENEFRKKLEDVMRENIKNREQSQRLIDEEREKWEIDLENVKKNARKDCNRKLVEQKEDLEKQFQENVFELLQTAKEQEQELKVKNNDLEQKIAALEKDKLDMVNGFELEKQRMEGTIKDLFRKLLNRKDNNLQAKNNYIDEIDSVENTFGRQKEDRETRRQHELQTLRTKLKKNYQQSLVEEKDFIKNLLDEFSLINNSNS